MRAVFLADTARVSSLRALNYSPLIERLRRTQGSTSSVPLGSLVRELAPAYGAVFTRRDCDPEYGVRLLSQVDAFSAEPACRVIRRDSMAHPERHLVRKWQVLIAGAGQIGDNTLFGRAIIADERLAGAYVGPDLVTLGFEEPTSNLSLFTYAFLASAVGLAAVRSTAYGTSIPRTRFDLLSALPIPAVTVDVQRQVADLVRTSVCERERYAQHIQLARAAIGAVPGVAEAHELSAQRGARCVLWKGALATLSPWVYASAGESLAYLQGKWRARLGDILEPGGVFRGLRFARVPCEPPFGVELLSQRDLFLFRHFPRRVAHPGVDDHWLFAPPGTLLVGGRGTLGEGEIFGRVTYTTDNLARYALTEDLLRARVQPRFSALAYAFLSTSTGLRLLRSTAVGTKILSMRHDLLKRLPVPEASEELISTVTGHVNTAAEARDRAHAAEHAAVTLVDEAVQTWLA